jgi:FkbM family methyltransferase
MNARQLIKYLLFKDTTFHGEFRMMERLAGPDAPRTFVDVGANDGFYGSNSFPFVARGWRSLLIEPHPGAFAQLTARHAGRTNVTCLNVACGPVASEMELHFDRNDSSQSTLTPGSHPHFNAGKAAVASVRVQVRPLSEILAAEGFADVGILSIDTEGWDFQVLQGLDTSRHQPRCIVTEDGEGAQTAHKHEWLGQHGYRQDGFIAPNSFWTRL